MNCGIRYTRISVSIPVELYNRVKKFNDMNRTRPVNISATCCVAIEKELEETQ